MNILIVGYGNIGKHIYEELKTLQPYIKDPFQPQVERYPCKDCTVCELGCCVQQKEAELGYFYDFAFICVPTDMRSDGSCDTSIVEQVVSETNAGIIVIKSTVPPGTTQRLIGATDKKIVFSPEHYGVTQHCKTDPGFVILGGEKEHTAKVAELYAKVKNGYYKINFTDSTTAELSKYMLNSFLALKVTFCNELADLANQFGVSYPELRELFILDERIGSSHTFVYPDKPYYDSHCFNKDIPALVQFAGDSVPLLNKMNEINHARKNLSAGRPMGRPLQVATPPMESSFEGVGTPVADNAIEPVQTERPSDSDADCKYACSICLIIRDENEYLEEWLNWHIGQGVQHFYIYDHGSKEPVTEFVYGLGAEIARMVTVIDWSGLHGHAQSEAYNDCLARFGKESKWIGFIDADEHVRVKTGQSLPEFLNDYEDYAGIFVVWLTYDANGQRYKSSLPLRQRFQKLNRNNPWANDAGKVFVQPIRMEDMYIHNGHTKEGFYIVGEHKDMIPEFAITNEDATTDLICVDHYYTKSYEEWVEKLQRGSCDSNFSRKYEEFFEYNLDMEYCREEVFPIQQYEESLKNVDAVHIRRTTKHNCSICLIIRDESEYLEEWLNWHISQGVQHFYIYDHGSSEPVAQFIQSLGSEIAGKVTVMDWSGSHENAQPDAYNDCLKRFGSESKWIGFIDADEHVRLRAGQTLSEFLSDYEDYAGVFAVWRTYGASGQKYKVQAPLRERFQTLSPSQNNGVGKVFVQPCLMKNMYIHNGCPVEGYAVVGEYKDFVPDRQKWKASPTTDFICIDHYFTKSYEEWLEKLKRGRCHAHYCRKYDEFFDYNPDMAYCREDIQITQEYEKQRDLL